MTPLNTRSRSILLALLVVFLWATSWVFIKIGLEEIPALTFAGLRYTLAFVCLLPILLLSQGHRSVREIPGKGWLRLGLLGVLFYAATQGASFLALAYLPAVTVNLIWSFSSVMVAIFGLVWLAEQPKPHQWFGIGLATTGAVLYFSPTDLPDAHWLGVAVSVLGVCTNAGASLLGRSINRTAQFHPLTVTTISMGVGAAFLLTAGVSIQGLPPIGAAGWGIILWLAVVNTAFAFTLWNRTLQDLTAMESSIINGTMLIWIPILAVTFLKETLEGHQILGLCTAGAGTLLVQIQKPKALSPLRSVLSSGAARQKERSTPVPEDLGGEGRE